MTSSITGMINILLFSFFATLIYTPVGSLFFKGNFNKSNIYENFSRCLIYSLIILSFIALVINFFFPLDKTINNLALLAAIFAFFFFKKDYFNKKYFIFSLVVSILTFLLITKSHTYRPDAGLYHLPYIGILNSEKIIFGLTNLHFRFGHTSIIQHTSAIFNNTLLKSNGIVLPSALIFSAILINFFSQIFNNLKEKKYNFHLFFLFFSLIFILVKMGRYSEFGNDIPSHLLFLFLISELLRNDFIHNKNEIKNFFILSIFIFLNKVFLIISIFFPFIFINKKNVKEIFISKKAVFGTLFLLFWIMKNIIVSGCALYPMKQTCIKNVSWIDIEKVEIISNESEAWSKSWASHKKQISHIDYIKSFYWFKTWINNNGLKTFKIVIPYALALIIIMFLILNKNGSIYKFSEDQLQFSKKIIIISFVGIMVWFIKAPDYRYGSGYIISFTSLLFSFIVVKNKVHNKVNKFIFPIIAICFLFFLTKNLNRIVFSINNYNNYPWPKYYSHGDMNMPKKHNKIEVNGKSLYKANGPCMFSLSPCSSQIIDFNVEKKLNYYFFVKK